MNHPERQSEEVACRSPVLSRRQLLKVAWLALLGHVMPGTSVRADSPSEVEDYLGTEESTEAPRHIPLLLRVGKLMEVTNRHTSETLDTLHQHWQEFYQQQGIPSPEVGEAAVTSYGPAAVSYRQLELKALEFQRLAEGLYHDPWQIPQHLRDLIIGLYSTMVSDPQLKNHPLNSQAFADRFYELLREFGYDGVLATKSPADLGRVFETQIWDKLAERWFSAGRLVVLDVASGSTFRHQADQNYPHENLVNPDGTPVNMGWFADISHEVIDSLGLVDPNRAHFVRFIDTEASDLAVTSETYPPHLRPDGVTDEYHHLGQEISNLLNHTESPSVLKEFLSQVNSDTTMSSLVHDALLEISRGLNSDSPISTFTDLESNDINLAIIGQSTKEPGFPQGNFSQHRLLTRLAEVGACNRLILSINRADDLRTIQTGLFILEEYAGLYGSARPIISGFSLNDMGMIKHCFIDHNGSYHELSHDDFVQTYFTDQQTGELSSTHRLTVYH